MRNNFIQKNQPQNAKLLSILTSRQRVKSLSDLKNNDWPGKYQPKLTSTIRMQSGSELSPNNLKNVIKERISRRSKFTTLVPSVCGAQQGPLQLKPFRLSNTILVRNNSASFNFFSSNNKTVDYFNCYQNWYRSHSTTHKSRRKYHQNNFGCQNELNHQNTHRIIQNEIKISKMSKEKLLEEKQRKQKILQNDENDQTVYQSIFKNSKISDHVVDAINNKINLINKNQKNKNQKLSKSNNQKVSTIRNQNIEKMRQNQSQFDRDKLNENERKNNNFVEINQTKFPPKQIKQTKQIRQIKFTKEARYDRQRKIDKNNMFFSKYKIDFKAFGFVDKVIDNPQLWVKYVRKLQN